ncbi:hypothetical protein ACIRBX_20100 [Kitasatospora sp. NPDC096147]|uniref:hypothetical protein n=1 Tax=Kitasatospora sp. NPDC096147 TaxID=3364093 RepID=UPI00382728EA
MRKLLPVIALAVCLVAAAAPVATAVPAVAPVPVPHGPGWVSAFEPAAGPDRPGPHLLRGSGRLDLNGPVPTLPDRIDLAVDAVGVTGPGGGDPLWAGGQLTMQHVFAGEGTVRIAASVDCVTGAGADGTVVTGRVETFEVLPVGQPAPPVVTDWHPEVSVSFHRDADGHPRVGWSGAPRRDDPSAPPKAFRCQAPALGAGPELHLVDGGFARLR